MQYEDNPFTNIKYMPWNSAWNGIREIKTLQQQRQFTVIMNWSTSFGPCKMSKYRWNLFFVKLHFEFIGFEVTISFDKHNEARSLVDDCQFVTSFLYNHNIAVISMLLFQ